MSELNVQENINELYKLLPELIKSAVSYGAALATLEYIKSQAELFSSLGVPGTAEALVTATENKMEFEHEYIELTSKVDRVFESLIADEDLMCKQEDK